MDKKPVFYFDEIPCTESCCKKDEWAGSDGIFLSFYLQKITNH